MFRILTFDYNVSQKWLDFKDGCIVGIYLVFSLSKDGIHILQLQNIL